RQRYRHGTRGGPPPTRNARSEGGLAEPGPRAPQALEEGAGGRFGPADFAIGHNDDSRVSPPSATAVRGGSPPSAVAARGPPRDVLTGNLLVERTAAPPPDSNRRALWPPSTNAGPPW